MEKKLKELINRMIDVTAAIIEREGKYLIAKRRKGKHLEGKWEFPGGRVEDDDKNNEECLSRELEEEFEIAAAVGDFFGESVYDYGGGREVRLFAYNARYISGDFVLNAHDKIKWVSVHELNDYDFAEADKPFIKKLINS